MLETSWEAGDALPSLPHIAKRPFEGHPSRSIYQPVAPGDEYFPTVLYDAMALAYGTQQAGDLVWPEMQSALALDDRSQMASYPVADNVSSDSGAAFTGVVVQYEGDGIADPHTIFSQRDEVKHQYGCFFASFQQTGVATVPEPAPLSTPCP